MPREKGPGLSSTGNRVLLAVVLAVAVYAGTGSAAAALVVAVVIYLLATVVARLGRRE